MNFTEEFFDRLFSVRKGLGKTAVTSGSTQGVQLGIQTGLHHLRLNHRHKNVVLVASDRRHYCVDKVAGVLGLNLIEIPSTNTGGSEACALGGLKEQLANQDALPIVIASGGSTFHGIADDLGSLKSALTLAGFDSTRRWIHLDAASTGLHRNLLLDDQHQRWSVGEARDDNPHEVNSVNVSTYKFIGGLVGGTVTVYKPNLGLAALPIEMLDAQMVAQVAHHLRAFGEEGIRREALRCLQAKETTLARLRALYGEGAVHGGEPYALQAVFPAPLEPISTAFQLMVVQDQAHISILPGPKLEANLDRFLFTLEQAGQTRHCKLSS